MIGPGLVAGARIVALLGVAAALLYAVVRYRHNVLQGPAFALVVASALALALAVMAGIAGLPVALVEAIQLCAAAFYAGATWLFAREFVDFGPEPDEDPAPPELELSAEGGGFEDD